MEIKGPTRINVRAVFVDCSDILSNYVTYSEQLRSRYESHIQDVKKRLRRGGNFLVPPVSLPHPVAPKSSDVSQSHEPNDGTPKGSNGRTRPKRDAALRARKGVVESYKLMEQKKLRRPSDFDVKKGFQPMPTIPATPSSAVASDNDDGGSSTFVIPPPPPPSDADIFRRPALPPALLGPSKSDRPSRSTRAREDPSKVITSQKTSNVPTDDSEDSESKGVRRSKRMRASKKNRKDTNQDTQEVDRKSRTRASKRTANSVWLAGTVSSPEDIPRLHVTKKSKLGAVPSHAMSHEDTECAESREPVVLVDTETLKTRVNSLRKNKPEAVPSPTVPNRDAGCVEPMETETLKSQNKTLRKNKPEAVPSPEPNREAGCVEPSEPNEPMETETLKSRTKTVRKNKPEDVPSPTVPNRDAGCIEPSEPNEPMETETLKSRTKTIRKNKQEAVPSPTVPNVDAGCVESSEPGEPIEMETLKSRTKTIRKNKPEPVPSPTVPNVGAGCVEPNEPGEPMETETLKSRTKTIRKNKPEPVPSLTVPNEDTEFVEPSEPGEQKDTKTRTKAHRKKTAQKLVEESSNPESTFLVTSAGDGEPESADVSKAPFKAKRKPKKPLDLLNIENSVRCSEDVAVIGEQERPEEMSRRSKRSSSCPRDLTLTKPPGTTVQVADPMDTLELPAGMDCFVLEQGSSERLDDPSRAFLTPVTQSAPRTRSKMKALAESRSKSAEPRKPGQGKENTSGFPINFVMGVLTDGAKRATPLAVVNKTGSAARNKPARFAIENAEKAKMAEARRKEEEAMKKKQELMLLKKQEIRNQRETKIKKVVESRKAVEKEKLLQLEKEKKEREEKEKLAKAEMMKQKEEALMKKKLLNQQKAQEAEERRLKEEQFRLARLREQEEQQRVAAEARQRQVEEAERLAALRKLQQKEEEQRSAGQARLLEKTKEAVKPTKALDPEDYGIDEDDGDGDDAKPRRPIPKWAEKEARNARLRVQTSVAPSIVRTFFNVEPRSPNLREIFGRDALIRPRTSSAVWVTTPPLPPTSP